MVCRISPSIISHKNSVQMTKNTVWIYDQHHLRAYSRAWDGSLTENRPVKIDSPKFTDVVYRDGVIISGHE